ncbi:MAG: ribonuclease [Rhizobiaceae bacterium]
MLAVLPLGLIAACGEQNTTPPKFSGEMVLAVSWQPGFCETRPRLPECRSQKKSHFDASHFSLHGLWPQPRSETYCGVSDSEMRKDTSRQWSRLLGLGLAEDLQRRLLKVMPGARSFLHRHEWIKHGTCYSDDPNVYYEDSLLLMEQVNASSLQNLFARSIGKRLTARQIRRAWNAEFGPQAGERLRISCKRDGRRTIITELTIGLSGKITQDSKLEELIAAAKPTRPGCPAGIVDPAGLQ